METERTLVHWKKKAHTNIMNNANLSNPEIFAAHMRALRKSSSIASHNFLHAFSTQHPAC
jgi:hypothetical protein